jgi:hypothetical protein
MDARENTQYEARAAQAKWLMDGQKSCSIEGCDTQAIVVLGQKHLCLNHFIIRCYEWLDYLDPMIRGRICALPELSRIQALVEECSNRTLLVSLRCEDLSNIDRSRLLDILLLSSDLLFILRLPRSEPEPLLAFRAKNRVLASAPAPAEKSAAATP